MSNLPKPKIRRRAIDVTRERIAREAGFDEIVARVIAGRPFSEKESPRDLLSPKLKTLDPPFSLADIEKASTRVALAIEKGEIIAIETDHDCDGQTSHAVIFTALTQHFGHPAAKIQSFIGHRLKEGYGLSEAVAKRILAQEPRATLVITADNGSSDEVRIALLKSEGIDVIVTDHHEIPLEGIPKSAFAVINPTREDCQYPDRFIAGCMVAWLLMAAVKHKLEHRRQSKILSLASCLDFVAVGTIADCVSIARSRNNRAVVAYGMQLIEQATRPCWRALLPLLSLPLSSEDLGFKIGPLLNSDGRLACAFGSVSFLLAGTNQEAQEWVAHLQNQNQERKAIQDRITTLALEQACVQYKAGKMSLSVYLEEGHAGVHGISASRLKDAFGRPVIIFCPKSENPALVTGSARSVDGLHLREALEAVNQRAPNLLASFGGHQGAAGLSLERGRLEQFSSLFEQVVLEKVTPCAIGPVILTDGELPAELLNLEYMETLLSLLNPFGREFEPPQFEAKAIILTIKLMGEKKNHARLGLMMDEMWFEAVWFNCCEEGQMPSVQEGDKVSIVYSPKLQTFRRERQLKCQIVHLEREMESQIN